MKRAFYISSGILLSLLSMAKVVSATGDAKVLSTIDPIFFMSFRTLFCVIAVFEIAVAILCFRPSTGVLRPLAICWLSTSIVFYRLGLIAVGYHKPCGCLGGFTDALRLSPEQADIIAKCVLVYLLIGGYTHMLISFAPRLRVEFKTILAKKGNPERAETNS